MLDTLGLEPLEKRKRISRLLTLYKMIHGFVDREPPRVTSVSNTLIDLGITNSPEKVTKLGVIHLGISDHSLVFLTRKAHYDVMVLA